ALASHWWLDVTPLELADKDAVLDAVRGLAGRGGQQGWVVGFGYDPSRLAPEHPGLDARELDAVAGAMPVLLLKQAGQIAYANHAALTIAGIGADTPDPPAGRYGRDDAGRLTGVVYEAPAIQTLMHRAPQPTAAEIVEMGARTLREFAARGCTTI